MNKLVILSLVVAFSCANAQDTALIEYLDSFKVPKSQVIYFSKVVNECKAMSEEEALKFLYNDDRDRLFCTQKSINMENEKDYVITKSIYLPMKCFKVQNDSMFMIAYVTWDCSDFRKPFFREMNITLYDKELLKLDSLSVYKADEFDFVHTGLMNLNSWKIFIVGDFSGKHQAKLFEIVDRKFVMTSKKGLENISFDSLEKYLKYLRWENDFQ